MGRPNSILISNGFTSVKPTCQTNKCFSHIANRSFQSFYYTHLVGQLFHIPNFKEVSLAIKQLSFVLNLLDAHLTKLLEKKNKLSEHFKNIF